jgi:hypothetical protein
VYGDGQVKHGAILDQRAAFLLIETGTGGGVGAAVPRVDRLLRAHRRESNGKRE